MSSFYRVNETESKSGIGAWIEADDTVYDNLLHAAAMPCDGGIREEWERTCGCREPSAVLNQGTRERVDRQLRKHRPTQNEMSKGLRRGEGEGAQSYLANDHLHLHQKRKKKSKCHLWRPTIPEPGSLLTCTQLFAACHPHPIYIPKWTRT